MLNAYLLVNALSELSIIATVIIDIPSLLSSVKSCIYNYCYARFYEPIIIDTVSKQIVDLQLVLLTADSITNKLAIIDDYEKQIIRLKAVIDRQNVAKSNVDARIRNDANTINTKNNKIESLNKQIKTLRNQIYGLQVNNASNMRIIANLKSKQNH